MKYEKYRNILSENLFIYFFFFFLFIYLFFFFFFGGGKLISIFEKACFRNESKAFFGRQRKLWSDYVHAQADRVLRWTHIPSCKKCWCPAHFVKYAAM